MVQKVYLAKPRGYCAGVVMAIDAVKKNASSMAEDGNGELTVYHSIVHNDEVVNRLANDHDVHFVEDLTELDGIKPRTDQGISNTVVFSAHGVSPDIRKQAEDLRLATIDATCPLVTKVHNEAKRFAKQGYHILLIGDSTRHQEVIGTQGEAPDSTTVVSVLGNHKEDSKLADPLTVEVPDPEKVVILTQTTLSVDDTDRTIEVLRRRFPRLTLPSRDDLCFATKNRQDAVKKIAPFVELFIVVTSDYSSNGTRLLELAGSLTGAAHRVDGAPDLDPSWFSGVESVGITSAASTPDDLVQDIVSYFQAKNPEVEVIEEGEWENIHFREPKRVPPLNRARPN